MLHSNQEVGQVSRWRASSRQPLSGQLQLHLSKYGVWTGSRQWQGTPKADTKYREKRKLRRQQVTPCINKGEGDTFAWMSIFSHATCSFGEQQCLRLTSMLHCTSLEQLQSTASLQANWVCSSSKEKKKEKLCRQLSTPYINSERFT